MKKTKFKGRLKTFLRFSIYLGMLLGIVDVGVCMFDLRAGLIVTTYTAVYFAVTLTIYYRNRAFIMNDLITFATEFGQVQKKLLRELELPYALLDHDGKVIWTNEAFESMVHQPKGYSKSITSLFPMITKDRLPAEDCREVIQYDLAYEGGRYVAKFERIPLDDMIMNTNLVDESESHDSLIAAYFYDETALQIALKEIDDQSVAVGMIYLDNYDEALESVESVRRSLLTALIERKINKYISSYDGICKKMEKDKYIIVLRKKAVMQIMEARFDLLEEVKTVNIGNDMAVTISIGMGLDGLSYAQNYEFARNSIDLALGRGGDQAVIKTPGNVSYFGGKSQHVDKNTRVKARVKAHALREIITAKDHVLVMGHKMADVDSFGSAVGICRVAQALERKAYIVLDDVPSVTEPLVEMFKNSPDYEEDMIIDSNKAMELAGNNAVLVVVDVNKPSLTECPELLKNCKSVVVLDHHRQSTETIENATLSYVEPYASSACEMVSEILQYTSDNIKISVAEADCMYSGIMIDTNNFMSKTGVRTFEAAAFLRRCGADVTRVRQLFRTEANEYKAKAEAIGRAEIHKESFAITTCNAEGLASPTITGAQVADELLDIKGIRASFVLTEYQGTIYVSARSIGSLNVQVIMERMGGGGHMNAAACQMDGATLAEAREAVKTTLDLMLASREI
jgi:c-di-AMP phosphodiesterase-like protein